MGLANYLASAVLHQQQLQKQNQKQQGYFSNYFWKWQRPAEVVVMPWTMVCGLLLFAVGLIRSSQGTWFLIWSGILNALLSGRGSIRRIEIIVPQLIYGNQSFQTSIMAAATEVLILQLLYVSDIRMATYLTSGGFDQQRTGITDAVVVAMILNATLVVPELDQHSYWKDGSDFFQIFDVDWFISYFAKDVPIVKRVPEKFVRSMEKPPYTMRIPRKSEPEYYLEQVLPILLRRHIR